MRERARFSPIKKIYAHHRRAIPAGLRGVLREIDKMLLTAKFAKDGR